MEDILKLKEDRKFKLWEAKNIVDKASKEDRELTDDEKAMIKENQAEARLLEARIAKLEEDEKVRQSLAADLESLDRVETRKTTPAPSSETAMGAPRVEIPRFRYGALRSYPQTPQGEERAYRVGMYLAANLFGKGWAQRWIRDNAPEFRVMTEGVNTAGGYLVPDEMSMAIIDLREKYGVFRQNVRVEPMSSDTKMVPRRTGGLTAYFAGEGGTGTETTLAWDSVGLVAKKLSAKTRFSAELGEDAVINLADTCTNEIAYAFALKEDTVGFTGTGSATDGGIVGVCTKFTNNTGLAGYVNATAGHDSASEIDATDLSMLMAALPEYAAANAKFYCSRVMKSAIFDRLAASAGGNTVQTLQGTTGSTYLGYPIVTTQVMEKTLTAGGLNDKVIMLFGDLSLAATLGNRRDITIGLTDQRYWEEDQIGVKGTERIDINVHDVGDTTNAGPIVALIGQT